MKEKVAVVGLGEVGQPLLDLVTTRFDAVGLDVRLPDPGDIGEITVLHLCIPFEIPDFVGEAARYIARYQPAVTIINSTVAVGTTRAVHEASGASVVNSPVRGKHARMLEELQAYVKFIGATDDLGAELADSHFRELGVETRRLGSPEATELAKLSETTYFGLLITWAQEVQRYCDAVGADYDEVVSIYDEIGFFPPVKYFPGVIGGHCVMPNIEILLRLGPSDVLSAIKASNEYQVEREAQRTEVAER